MGFAVIEGRVKGGGVEWRLRRRGLLVGYVQ